MIGQRAILAVLSTILLCATSRAQPEETRIGAQEERAALAAFCRGKRPTVMLGEWRMWLEKARTMTLDDHEIVRKGTSAGAAVDGTVQTLVGLDRQFKRIGVKLVIAVAPFKEAVYADVIRPELGTPPPRLDHQMQRFVQKLEAAGVAVVDTTPMLLAERTRSNEDLFGKLGYNWSPRGGFLCGREVARLIRDRGWYGEPPRRRAKDTAKM